MNDVLHDALEQPVLCYVPYESAETGVNSTVTYVTLVASLKHRIRPVSARACERASEEARPVA